MENTKETIKDDTMYELSELFKVFADYTRVKLMYALFDGELCVQDLAEKLDMTQSAISHQLRVLKAAKLVKGRRNGKQVYYSLADEHVETILGQGLDHVLEDEP